MFGLSWFLLLAFIAVFAYQVAPYPQDVSTPHFYEMFKPPSFEHIFGTDEAGRDVLSRVIIGSRVSVATGLLVLVLAATVGVPAGLASGYIGGALDSFIMRVADVIFSIPPLVLALCVTVILTPSLENSMIAIAFAQWPWYARLVRGEVVHVKGESYVEAARSLGASASYIAFVEILPNVLTPIIVRMSLDLGYAILTLAALGFLGLGAKPPTPEWGTIAGAGRVHLPNYWWITTFSGLAIFMTVLASNLLGDGLRDALEPQVE